MFQALIKQSQIGVEQGKGSGKHLFSREGRIGKTVGFPGRPTPI